MALIYSVRELQADLTSRPVAVVVGDVLPKIDERLVFDGSPFAYKVVGVRHEIKNDRAMRPVVEVAPL